jgi:uncharacterized phage infection (PIP) family protein YhgE
MSEVTPAQAISRQLSVAFIISLIAGIALVALHPLAPCIALIAYGLLGLLLTKNQKNSDQFADSLYYLGFLITLSALLIALIGLESKPDAVDMARKLGAGLAASILGLGFRVLIIQFRGTVSDQEEEARESIEEQAAKVRVALEGLAKRWSESSEVLGRLRADLDQFRGDLQSVHKSTLDAAQEREKQVSTATTKALEAWEAELLRVRQALSQVEIPPNIARDAFTHVAKDLGKGFSEVTSAVAQTLDAAIKPLGTLGPASEKCVTQIGQLGRGLQDAHNACVSIQAAAETLAKSISESGREAGLGLASIANGAAQLEQSAKATITALGRAAPIVDNLDRQAQVTSQLMSGVGQELKNASSGVLQQVQSVAADIDKVQSATTELDRQAQAAAKVLASVGHDIKAAADGVARNVHEVAEDVGKVREATAELVDLARKELAKST